MDNSEYSKEELSSDNSEKQPFKRFSKFLAKSTPINKKRMSQKIHRINNLLDNSNHESTPKKSENKKDKHLLILHKINIKDKKNNFYKKGATDIFNDENLFFSQYYKDKPVIVGKNKDSLFYVKYYNKNESQRTQNINNFGKTRLYRNTKTSKNLFIIKENGHPLRNSISSVTNDLRKNKFVDKSIKNAYDFQYNKNNVAANAKSIIGKYESLKNSYNIFGKRAPIFFSSNSYVTDGELKIIYEKFIDKVKDRKKKELLKLKLYDKKFVKKGEGKNANEKDKDKDKDVNHNNNTLYKKIFKTTIDKEMYARLGLQEKILNKFQNDKKENQKLIHKIKNYTNKSCDDLLINQLDNYRNKLEKIEQNERKIQEKNYNKAIYWLSSLRNYPQKNSIRTENENSQNNSNNNSTLPIIKKNNSSINSIKFNSKDDIFDNYINNIHYSFGNNSNLYCDIESNIRPLCGLILPENYQEKEKEKITNTHIDDNLIANKNSIYNAKELKKNISTPSLINKNPDKELKIEGKGLLDYEIGIYNELKGKRKKLLKMNYNDEEIDSKIFAKSYLLNNFYFPKAVKNTFNMH